MTTPTPPPDMNLADPNRTLRGASAVRYGIAKYLKDSYTETRNRCLNGWKMQGSELPPIAIFSPFDNIQITNNDKPMLGVDPVTSGQYKTSDRNVYGSNEYRPTYSMRVTIWLFSPNDESGNPLDAARTQVIRQRDDQLAVLKTAILARPSLATETLYVPAETIQETYLAPTAAPNNSKRWLIAGQLSFDVQADEWVTFDAVGRVVGSKIGVDTEVLLNHDRPPFNNVNLLP